MGSTAGVAVDGIVLGVALILFGFFVVLSIIPMSEAPVIGAAGAAVVGLYVASVRHQAALGLLLVAVGVGALAVLFGLV